MIHTMGRHVVIPSIMSVRTFAPRTAAGAAADWAQWFDHFWVAKGAADLATSYADLVGSQSLTPGSVAPTLDEYGWHFDGDGWLKTGHVSTLDWSLLVRFYDVTASDQVCIFGDTWFSLWPSYWTCRAYRYTTTVDIAGSAITAGVMGISKNHGYLNGSVDLLAISDPYVLGRQICIGAAGLDSSGTDAENYSTGSIITAGIAHRTLSDAEFSAASAAMAAL